MFASLPTTAADFADWDWTRIQPLFDALAERPLTPVNVDVWLADWSRLAALVRESHERLWVATTLDTGDADAEARYKTYLQTAIEPYEVAAQSLKTNLLASSLEPTGFSVPLRKMRADAALFANANLPLLTQEKALVHEYDRIMGAQTVLWDGAETTLEQLRPALFDPDRAVRERAWRATSERQLLDRDAINALWTKLLRLRGQLAANAGLPDYRAYRWQELGRFDYTPDDCARFHDAIEAVVVPAANRLYARRQRALGVETVRPWDTDVDPYGRPPLKPYTQVNELIAGTRRIFEAVDPRLAVQFDRMVSGGALDLENRKGKAPGGYCTEFLTAGEPFIFMNAVGLHDDVQTLLHEGGHAFHIYAVAPLPFLQQKDQDSIPIEFLEVASTGMELLGQRYLAKPTGFYTPEDAARATCDLLEGMIRFWPYMAVVDAFQHWACTHVDQAADPAACDARWAELWLRFMPGEDWTGLDEAMKTGWQRKAHIHEVPFYYVEYGIAQLGALQLWRASLDNPQAALDAYHRALALGYTAPLPDLFATAGGRFALDVATLRECVELAEGTIERLSAG